MFTSCWIINLSVCLYSFIIIVTFLLRATGYSARFTIVCLSPPHEAWIRRGEKKTEVVARFIKAPIVLLRQVCVAATPPPST